MYRAPLFLALMLFAAGQSQAVSFHQPHFEAQIQANVLTVENLTSLLSEGANEKLEWWMTEDQPGEKIPTWTEIIGNTANMTPVLTDIKTWDYTLHVKEINEPTKTDSTTISMGVTALHASFEGVFAFVD